MLEKRKEYRRLPIILLAVIILVQIIHIGYRFVSEKTSYHCDELYSYGLSNSFYQPFLEGSDVYSGDFQNVNEWFSGKEYREYLTVQKGEQFRYDSVWYNQSKDRHPPLFYAVLHTVCSFFPDTFSFWYGMIPNLIYFAVMQFFLYKLSRNILKSKYLSLLLCLFWGFTPAAVNNTLFIRMYCMLAMWTVILMYLHSKLYQKQEPPRGREFIPLVIVTALGALTQYLFLFVAFVTAVCFCIRYLLKKQRKAFLLYGCSMLGGVLIAFALFPASISHLLSEEGNAVKSMFGTQILISLRYLFYNDVFCIQSRKVVWLFYFLPAVLGILVILALPILFLFRNDPKVKAFPSKMKQRFCSAASHIKKLGIRGIIRGIWHKMTNIDGMLGIMFLSVVTVVLVASYTVSYLIGFANRYLYIIYPLAAVCGFSLLYFVFSRARHRKQVMTVVTVLMILNVFLHGNIVSYWQYENDLDLHKTFHKSNVIVVLNERSDFSALSSFSYELYNADDVFITDYNDLSDCSEQLKKLPSDAPLYLMMYTGGTSDDGAANIFSHTAFDGEKYYLKNENVQEYLNQHIPKEIAHQYEYIGSYEFIEGMHLIYRLR